MTSTCLTAPVGKSSEPLISSTSNPSSSQTHYCYNQLPFPISPATQSFPPVSPPSFAAAHTTDAEATPLTQPNTNLVPIKGFIHEVLCKSYMSCGVLQAAQSYLGGICAKVPELVEEDL